MTADYFDYEAEGNLAGQAGGGQGVGAEWTSVWTPIDNTPSGGVETPVDYFQTVEYEKVQAGDSGGEAFEIGRGMNLAETINLGYGIDTELEVPIHLPGSTFFTTEMTAEAAPPSTMRSLDTPGAWEAGVEFRDQFGVTAGFGMRSDGTSQNFYGKLGSSIGYSAKVVEEDTLYWLYGALDQNYDGTDDERFSVWVNPIFSDMYSGLNADIVLFEDLDAGLAPGEERGTLGDQVVLRAQTSSTGPPAPTFTFDDIQVARDIELLSAPRLDIGQGAGRIQEGFELWDVSHLPDQQIDITFDQSDYYPSLDPATYVANISIESLTPGEDLTFFNHTFGTPGEGDDMRGDGVYGTGGLKMTFSGMLGDMYLVKLYLFHPTESADITVTLSYDDVVYHHRGVSVSTIGDDDAREHSFEFDNRDPANFGQYLAMGRTVYVKITATDPNDIVSIVGMEHIPEPGTGLLVGMGLVGMAWRRHRQLSR